MLLALTIVLAPLLQAPTDAASALEAAVDLAEPLARRNAANALAARTDVTFERWCELARSFGRFEGRAAGYSRERAPLVVLGKVEDTELHIYVPASYDAGKPASLMLAFHGTGGTGEHVAPFWKATADALGMLVLAPSESGPNEGYGFSDRERAAAFAALRWMRRRFNVDETRVFASGVSRGGHLAWDLALRFPDRFAAIAPMIGSPRFNLTHGQNNLRFLENVVELPIRDLQGSKDDPGVLANLREAFARLEAWNAPDAKLIEFPERGHDFDFGAVEWNTWLGSVRRDPLPKRIVRAACEKGEARTAWLELASLSKEVVENLEPKVAQSTWNAMDEKARRAWLQKQVDERTARLEATFTPPATFLLKGTRVTSVRLFLPLELLDPAKPVVVTWNGKKIEKRARMSSKSMLQDFVERFDRSFLPVAVVEIP